MTPSQPRKLRAAAPGPAERAYFEAAADGRLLVRRCRECNALHHYPRALCPFCMSEKLDWSQARGTGEIYSFSVMRRGVEVPYCIAYVALDEGVTMMSNVVDCDLDALHIGQRVRVVFERADDGTAVPMFTPA